MKKRNFLIIFFLASLFLIPFGTSSQRCDLVILGSIPNRLLEIRSELIFIFSLVTIKYSKLSSLSSQYTSFFKKCDFGKCQPGDCLQKCDKDSCPPGESCLPPAGGGEICSFTPEEKEEKKKIFKEMEETAKEIKKYQKKVLELAKEIKDLEAELTQSKALLAAINPLKAVVLDCFEAKNNGLIKDCKHSLDYCIYPK